MGVEQVVSQGMSQNQFWFLVVAASVTALSAVVGLIMGIASKPFKAIREQIDGLREHMDGSVTDLKSDTSSIRSDLADIKSHLRNHDESLRGIMSGQRVIVESLGEVLPRGVHGVLRKAAEPSNVTYISGYMQESQDATAQHG